MAESAVEGEDGMKGSCEAPTRGCLGSRKLCGNEITVLEIGDEVRKEAVKCG